MGIRPRLMFLLTTSTSAIASPEGNLTPAPRNSSLKRRNLRHCGVPIVKLRSEPSPVSISTLSPPDTEDNRPWGRN